MIYCLLQRWNLNLKRILRYVTLSKFKLPRLHQQNLDLLKCCNKPNLEGFKIVSKQVRPRLPATKCYVHRLEIQWYREICSLQTAVNTASKLGTTLNFLTVLLNLVTNNGTTVQNMSIERQGNEWAINLSPSHQIFLKSSNSYFLNLQTLSTSRVWCTKKSCLKKVMGWVWYSIISLC